MPAPEIKTLIVIRIRARHHEFKAETFHFFAPRRDCDEKPGAALPLRAGFIIWNFTGAVRLTVRYAQGILGAMSPRPALMLLLVVALILIVCISSIWLIPAGRGSFSAVHGPNSIFVAKRAVGRMLSFIRTTLVVALLRALAGWVNAARDVVLSFTDNQVSTCVLTC
jgi:hypothetical protein